MNFDIGTVLSVVSGKLLTNIKNIYVILNYMLDENLYTHQIPRATKFAKDFILKQHPQLKNFKYEKINEENWKEHLEIAERMFGKNIEINKVPKGLWIHKGPIEELEEMIK